MGQESMLMPSTPHVRHLELGGVFLVPAPRIVHKGRAIAGMLRNGRTIQFTDLRSCIWLPSHNTSPEPMTPTAICHHERENDMGASTSGLFRNFRKAMIAAIKRIIPSKLKTAKNIVDCASA